MSTTLLSRKTKIILRQKLVERARTCFPTYLALMFPQYKGAPYTLEKFHHHVAGMLDDMAAGRTGRRRTLSAPPQHGKSRLVAVRFVSWLISARPGTAVALTGFNRALLVEFFQEVKHLVALPQYREIFSNVVPLARANRDDYAKFANGSSVVLRSAGSKLTGRRADWLIVDDPHAGRAEAESALQRRKVLQWFMADCLTRISPNARVLVIATRWHPGDLIGHLTSPSFVESLKEEGQHEAVFEHSNYAAVHEEGANDPLGRQPGEPLAPVIRPLAFLKSQKAILPSYDWLSLFQGAPRASASGQVDTTKLRYCTLAQVPQGIGQTRGWDLAITESQSADWTVGARLGLDRVEGVLYVMHIDRKRRAWARLRNWMIDRSKQDRAEHGIHKIGIEAVGGFDAVYSDIRKALLGEVSVVKQNPTRGGKLLRAQPWLTLIEAGKLVLVRDSSWNKDFVDELEAFPEGEHDDQIDAVSIGYETLVKDEPLLLG